MIRFENIAITPEILLLIAGIDEFKGAWRALGTLPPERLLTLRRIGAIESVGASTRIDGSELLDREVERLIANLSAKSFATRDEQEAAGYAKTLERVFRSWQEMAINEEQIMGLHRDLFVYGENNAWHRGRYKTSSNSLATFDETGKQIGVVFEATKPSDTPRQMGELVAWFETTTSERQLHPLLAIGVFVGMFLAIQPFQNGNGRLSRILITLLLLRAGYAFVPYSSLESVIEQATEAYSLALRQTQGTIWSESPNWLPWLLFFLRALQLQMQRLEKKVEREKQILSNMPDLSARILEQLRQHGRVSIGDMVKITGSSRNTLKEHFRRLVEKDYLLLHGKARGAWYSLR